MTSPFTFSAGGPSLREQLDYAFIKGHEGRIGKYEKEIKRLRELNEGHKLVSRQLHENAANSVSWSFAKFMILVSFAAGFTAANIFNYASLHFPEAMYAGTRP